MKRILTAFALGFALLVPNVVWGEGIDADDLVFRDDLLYEKFSDIPFAGKTSGKKQFSIMNGKYHEA